MNKPLFRLIAGFRRFREKYFIDDESHMYQKLASAGQSPKTMLIGCSDSRVDPAILTGANPGELFVVRNVANLVPPCEPSAVGFHGTSSALEFAVMNLKVENIIVLGHRQCGGVRALVNSSANTADDSFVANWMRIAESARTRVLSSNPGADVETLCRLTEMESIKVSVQNLRTFSFVQEAVDSGHLSLYGIYFDLEEGQLWEYDEQEKIFRLLDVERHSASSSSANN